MLRGARFVLLKVCSRVEGSSHALCPGQPDPCWLRCEQPCAQPGWVIRSRPQRVPALLPPLNDAGRGGLGAARAESLSWLLTSPLCCPSPGLLCCPDSRSGTGRSHMPFREVKPDMLPSPGVGWWPLGEHGAGMLPASLVCSARCWLKGACHPTPPGTVWDWAPKEST